MIQLAEEVQARGGTPLEPLEYKHRYHDLLWQQVGQRVNGLKSGELSAADWTVPEAHRLLEQITRRGPATKRRRWAWTAILARISTERSTTIAISRRR
jgi:hypothetical protein